MVRLTKIQFSISNDILIYLKDLYNLDFLIENKELIVNFINLQFEIKNQHKTYCKINMNYWIQNRKKERIKEVNDGMILDKEVFSLNDELPFNEVLSYNDVLPFNDDYVLEAKLLRELFD